MVTLTIIKAHDVTEEFNAGLAVESKYDIGTFTLQGRLETPLSQQLPTRLILTLM